MSAGPKVAPGIALGEIQTAIGDIDTVTAIMVMVGTHVPDDFIQREWFAFFGRAIEGSTERIEAVMERVA